MKSSWTIGLIPIFFLGLSLARAEPARLNRDTERVLQVVLDEGAVLREGMLAHEAEGRWYLPLGELSDAVGFAVSVSPALRGAEGFFLSEDRRFRLDLTHCQVEIAGHATWLESGSSGLCSGAVPLGEEIFVDKDLLEAWFPLRFSVDGFRSQLVVRPLEKIPLQIKMDRERRYSVGAAPDPGFETVDFPPSALTGPFVDQRVTWARSRDLGTDPFRSELGLDTAVGGEVLGFTGYSFFSLTGRNSANPPRLTFSRTGDMLGALHARQVQLVDIDFPTLPLVSAGRLAQGALISSFPLDQATSFSRQEIQGDVLPGWEVELYQNGAFVERQMAGERGRYSFRQLSLYYGQNQFHLVFLGPQGQRRDEYRNYRVDSSLVRPGARDYRVALARSGSVPLALLQVDQSLLENFSLSAAFANLTLSHGNEARRYVSLGLSGFGSGFLFEGRGAADVTGGHAWQGALQLPIREASLGLSYTRLNEFRSPAFNDTFVSDPITEQIDANAAFLLPIRHGVGSSWRLTRQRFEQSIPQWTLQNRLSTNTSFVYWSHELNVTLQSSPVVAAKLDAIFAIDQARYRVGLGYDPAHVQFVELERDGQLSAHYSLSAGAKESFHPRLTQFMVTLSRLFKELSLGGNVAWASNGQLSVGTTLALSLGREGRHWHGQAEPQAMYGAASARVFIDGNRNGRFDGGEEPLKGIGVLLAQQNTEVFTDDEGRAYFSRLAPDDPVDLSLSLRSLDNPFLRPGVKGRRLLPRAGNTACVDLPVVAVGEVDGVVEWQARDGLRPRRGVRLELLDASGTVVQKLSSDAEGAFWFQEIPPGVYSLRVDPAQRAELGIKSIKPESQSFVIPAGGLIESGRNFLLAF